MDSKCTISALFSQEGLRRRKRKGGYSTVLFCFFVTSELGVIHEVMKLGGVPYLVFTLF